MTDTGSGSKQASQSSRSRLRRRGRKTGVGLQPHKRTGIDIAIALLTPLVGQEFLDKYHLRDPLNRGLRYGTKTIFSMPPALPDSSSGFRTCAADRPGSSPAARTATT